MLNLVNKDMDKKNMVLFEDIGNILSGKIHTRVDSKHNDSYLKVVSEHIIKLSEIADDLSDSQEQKYYKQIEVAIINIKQATMWLEELIINNK